MNCRREIEREEETGSLDMPPCYDAGQDCTSRIFPGTLVTAHFNTAILKGWKSFSPGLRRMSYPGLQHRTPATLQGLTRSLMAAVLQFYPLARSPSPLLTSASTMRFSPNPVEAWSPGAALGRRIEVLRPVRG